MAMSIEEKVLKIVSEQLEVEEDDLDETSFLSDDLDADPYDFEEIAGAIAEEFGVEVTEEDYESWERVSDIVAFVHEKLDLAEDE